MSEALFATLCVIVSAKIAYHGTIALLDFVFKDKRP